MLNENNAPNYFHEQCLTKQKNVEVLLVHCRSRQGYSGYIYLSAKAINSN
jgi:hypothetical protein